MIMLFHCTNSFQMDILLSRRQLAFVPTLAEIEHMKKIISLLKLIVEQWASFILPERC